MSPWSLRRCGSVGKTGIWRWIDHKQAERASALGFRPSHFGRVKKSLTRARLALWTGVAQWDACHLTLLFLRRAVVSLDGWSARPCETSNGIWFWKRSLIPVGTERRRHTCLASRCGHCGTRSSNIQQRVSAFPAMRAKTRSWRNPLFCCFGGVIGIAMMIGGLGHRLRARTDEVIEWPSRFHRKAAACSCRPAQR